jgi:hypothetical protein
VRRPHLRSPSLLGVCAALLVVAGVGLFTASLVDGDDVPTVAAMTTDVSGGVDDDTSARWLPSDPEAVALFERAQLAARDITYDGVKLVSVTSGDATRTAVVNVSQTPARGLVVEAGDINGARDGSEQGETSTFSRGETSWADLTSDAAALRALRISYRLQLDGTGVVCDRAASVVAVRRIDGSTAARLWMDDETGILLRRELLDAAGEVTQTNTFVQIDIGTADVVDDYPTPSSTPWAVVADYEIDGLREDGWPVPESLGGGMQLSQVRRGEVDAGPVVQLSYTDGLTSMSVFLQRGELDESALDDYSSAEVEGGRVWVRDGSTPLIVWQSGSVVITAASDTSTAPLAQAVAALPAAPAPADGLGDRVERGFARVGSWFNPLG